MLHKESFPKFEKQHIVYAETGIFRQKVCEFSWKISCSSNSFLELGSHDPPLFAGLPIGASGNLHLKFLEPSYTL